MDLPVLLLYYKGTEIDRMPKPMKSNAADYGVESEDENSEDEREVASDQMKSRRDWDRSEVSSTRPSSIRGAKH